MRFLGTFLDDPVDVPPGVTGDLARQLEITDPTCLALYREGRVRWLHALCWTGTNRPGVLFDRATVWLVTEKVLLPGASALERLVSRIRARAARQLWRTLVRDVTRGQRAQLDALLLAGESSRPSPLDRLRDGPTFAAAASCPAPSPGSMRGG